MKLQAESASSGYPSSDGKRLSGGGTMVNMANAIQDGGKKGSLRSFPEDMDINGTIASIPAGGQSYRPYAASEQPPPEPLSLPVVHATINDAPYLLHSLRVNRTGVTLTPIGPGAADKEETKLPLSVILDVQPLDGRPRQGREPPTQHLVQILASLRKNRSPELAVLLALQSATECVQLVTSVAHFRSAYGDPQVDPRSCGPIPEDPRTTFGGASSSSASSEPGGFGSFAPPADEAFRLPVPSSTGRSPGATILSANKDVSLVVHEFLDVFVQVMQGKPASGKPVSDWGPGYQPCGLRLDQRGLVLESTSKAKAGAAPWIVPWASIFEASACEDPSEGTPYMPPQTHQCLVRIAATHRPQTNGAPCTVHIALSSDGGVDRFLSALKEQKRLQFAQRCAEHANAPIRSEHAAFFGTSLAQSDLQGGPGVPNATPPAFVSRCETMNQKFGQAASTQQLPVPLNASMASLLVNYSPADLEQPLPLELPQVWVYISRTFSTFQRCAISVDKLGLTVRPLVIAAKLPENGRKGAKAVQNGSDDPQEFVLMTETMNFPVSSVVDVVEDPDFNAAAAAETIPPPAPPPEAQRPGGGPPRKATMPFARALGHADGDEKSARSRLAPPHPHLVGVRIKGALAGRGPGQEKAPVQMRLRAQPPPPVTMVISFSLKDEAVQVISKMLAFKKYHLSVALAAHLNTYNAVSQREAQRQGHRLIEEGPLSKRMQSQEEASLVEPPPLPPRPSDLPPPSRLPRMVTNDEGEVFWYIPRKRAPKEQKKASVGPAEAVTGQVPEKGCPSGDTGVPVENRSNGVHPPLSPRTAAVTPGAGPRVNDVTELNPRGPYRPGDDEANLGPLDTPPPCLVSPTPSPGRPAHGGHGVFV